MCKCIECGAIYEVFEEVEADRKTEPSGYKLKPVEDEAQTDCAWK